MNCWDPCSHKMIYRTIKSEITGEPLIFSLHIPLCGDLAQAQNMLAGPYASSKHRGYRRRKYSYVNLLQMIDDAISHLSYIFRRH